MFQGLKGEGGEKSYNAVESYDSPIIIEVFKDIVTLLKNKSPHFAEAADEEVLEFCTFISFNRYKLCLISSISLIVRIGIVEFSFF